MVFVKLLLGNLAMSSADQNRRKHPRFKAQLPIEFHPEGSAIPTRGKTSDLSLTGCYVEMMFTFALGTKLELSLQVGDRTIRMMAIVVTRDHQVGNGIEFVDTLPEDRDALRCYLDIAEKAAAAWCGVQPPWSGERAWCGVLVRLRVPRSCGAPKAWCGVQPLFLASA